MRRSTRLALLGLVLLATALALPFVDFFTADWDRDFRYRTPTDGFCADAVAELSLGEANDSVEPERFVVDRSNLSAAARADVRRAEANGSYTVERSGEADGPFVFPSDHVARGTGCYALYDAERDEYRALVTESVNHRTDTFQRRAVRVGGPVVAGLGVLSLLAGVVSAVRRRRH
ncbi:hypothetical protein [Salinigranum rubrum]|nr:hypothetical protein [Salinigranum rubrum]